MRKLKETHSTFCEKKAKAPILNIFLNIFLWFSIVEFQCIEFTLEVQDVVPPNKTIM